MTQRRWMLAALFVSLCAPVVLAQDAPPPPLVEEPPATESKALPSTDADLERMTGEMMERIEVLRGLKFKQDVKRVWKSRDEARDEMLAEIDAEVKPEDMTAATRTMKFMGMLRPDQDLKQVFADFIAAGAGGYYLPDKKIFSLVRGFSEDASRPIVFHELVHAVEDQYYDYNDRTKRYIEEKREDHATALKAVVEGSARRFENVFVDSEPGLRARYMTAQMEGAAAQQAAMMKQPAALIISLAMFPYNNGDEFLAAVLPKMPPVKPGEDPMAPLFNDPPVSTEMILHPEKYLGIRDLPQDIVLPDLGPVLGEGWTSIQRGNMGEFGMGLALNAYLHPKGLMPQIMAVMRMPKPGQAPSEVVEFKGDTAKAIGGWDGDTYEFYSHGEKLVKAWVSVWDSEADAQEFATTFEQGMGKKYKGAAFEAATDGSRRATTGNAVTAIAVSGNRVHLVEGVSADKADATLEVLRKSTIKQDKNDSLPAR